MATGKVLTYVPKDVKLIIAGYIVGGVASVSISWTKPFWRTIRGAYGAQTRVKEADTSATLKVELLQTALANSIFNDVLLSDWETNGGRLEITLQDTSGKSVIFSPTGYCTGQAERRYSDDFDTRVWTFYLNTTTVSTLATSTKSIGDIFDSAFESASDVGNAVLDLF